VAWARERLEEGRARQERQERQEPHELAVLCLLSVSNTTPEEAKREIAAWAAPMLAQMADSPQLSVSHEGATLTAHLQSAQNEIPRIPDELLSRFVAAGTAGECSATAAALLEAGADRVILVPNPAGFRSTEAMVEQIRTASPVIQVGGG